MGVRVEVDHREQVVYLIDDAAPPGNLRMLVVPFVEVEDLREQLRAAVGEEGR